MRRADRFLLAFTIFVMVSLLTGCWNYREIESVSIVAGAAIDKENDEYRITLETIDIQAGKEANLKSEIFEAKGKTVFDAIRNVIQISGRRLYWAHSKIVIISQEIAEEDIWKPLDFFLRDGEPRINTNVIISKEKTAKAIYETEKSMETIKSLEIYEGITNQTSLLKAPNIELYNFVNDLAAKGKSAIFPVIGVVTNNNKKKFQISGTAVFKKNKLVGFLDDEETKLLHYILDRAKGGLLVGKEISKKDEGIALEVFEYGTTTKIKPEPKDDELSMKMDVYITAAIAENGERKALITQEEINRFRKEVEEAIEENIKALIEKVQVEYGSDIFGFGSAVKADIPKTWKSVENEWDEIFRLLDVKVKVHLKIANKAKVSQPIKIGD